MNKRTEEMPSLEFLSKLIEDDVCFYQLANSKKNEIFLFFVFLGAKLIDFSP